MPEFKTLILNKGEERYVYMYQDQTRGELLRLVGRQATNPELSFTWYDASLISHAARKERDERN